MPVTLRAALAAAGLCALLACGGSNNNGSSGGTTGGDAGNADAGLTCHGVDAGCTEQLDCDLAQSSSTEGVHAYACVSGACVREAGFTASCAYDFPLVQVQVTLSPDWGNYKPKTLEVRGYYPFRANGTTIHCADVSGTTDFPDGGSPLDVDPTLNAESIGAYAASCTSGGSCLYVLNSNLVRQTTPVLLVQGYSGSPQSDGEHPSGIRLGEGCVEGTSVTTDSQNIDVTVHP